MHAMCGGVCGSVRFGQCRLFWPLRTVTGPNSSFRREPTEYFKHVMLQNNIAVIERNIMLSDTYKLRFLTRVAEGNSVHEAAKI